MGSMVIRIHAHGRNCSGTPAGGPYTSPNRASMFCWPAGNPRHCSFRRLERRTMLHGMQQMLKPFQVRPHSSKSSAFGWRQATTPEVYEHRYRVAQNTAQHAAPVEVAPNWPQSGKHRPTSPQGGPSKAGRRQAKFSRSALTAPGANGVVAKSRRETQAPSEAVASPHAVAGAKSCALHSPALVKLAKIPCATVSFGSVCGPGTNSPADARDACAMRSR